MSKIAGDLSEQIRESKSVEELNILEEAIESAFDDEDITDEEYESLYQEIDERIDDLNRHIDTYELASDMIEHNISEGFTLKDIKKWIDEKDEFIWDKLVRHQHTYIFNDEDEMQDFCRKNKSEIFDVLNKVFEFDYKADMEDDDLVEDDLLSNAQKVAKDILNKDNNSYAVIYGLKNKDGNFIALTPMINTISKDDHQRRSDALRLKHPNAIIYTLFKENKDLMEDKKMKDGKMKKFMFNSGDELKLEKGQVIILNEDVGYDDVDEFVDTYVDFDGMTPEDAKKKLLDLGFKIEDNTLFIPKGSKMEFLGTESGGWPTFKVRDLELDFAGEPFEVMMEMSEQEEFDEHANHVSSMYKMLEAFAKENNMSLKDLDKVIEEARNHMDDVKEEFVEDTSCKDEDERARKILKDKMILDAAQFKDADEEYAKGKYISFINKVNQHDTNTIGISWIKKGDNSKLTFMSDIPAKMTKEEFEKILNDAKPENSTVNIIYVVEKPSSYEYEYVDLPSKQQYKLLDILDESFEGLYDIDYDDRTHELTIELFDNVKDIQGVKKQMVDKLYNLGYYISNAHDGSNLITFGLIDTATATKEAKFEVLLNDVNQWDKDSDASRVDLLSYYVENDKFRDSENDDDYPDCYNGVRATFYPEGFYEGDYDKDEFEKIMEHDGEECTIINCEIQVDEDSGFDDDYWNIKFDDGYEIEGVQGVSLHPHSSTKDEQLFIYQFPRTMKQSDINGAEEYDLEFLGKVNEKGFQPGDYLIQGRLEDLQRYCDEWLGYEMHPDYLYKDKDVDVETIVDSVK